MSMHALSALPNDREPLHPYAEARYLRDGETKLREVAAYLEKNDPDFDDYDVRQCVNRAIDKVGEALRAITQAKEMVE